MPRRTGSPGGPRRKESVPEPIGSVRRTQLITTYGVGSMIAVDDQSFIVSGLDTWRVHGEPDLYEFRLQTRLGVRGFRLPPAAETAPGVGVRVRRFPTMYTCPGRDEKGDGCEFNLRPYRSFNPPRNRSECGACGGQLTPSRFVVACEDGHLDDFPYWEWVHFGTPPGDSADSHKLSLTTTGRTASLRSIVIRCSCGKQASMEGAFGQAALRGIGVSCSGRRPWLGSEAGEQGCSKPLRTLQRGSSAAWFSVVRSALSIPPFSQKLYQDIYPHLRMLRGESEESIERLARKEPALDAYSIEEIVRAVKDYESYEAGERPDPMSVTGFEPADVLRAEEYKQLVHGDKTDEFVCRPAHEGPESLELPGLAQVMLVERLREVRALQAFTRVQAPAEGDPKERFAALSLREVDWLPGVEVLGEGVFLRLDDELLRTWESSTEPDSPTARAERIRRAHQDVLRRRAAPGRPVSESSVTARFVLIHTLAHALINEWSMEAGYPAASLRERLYVSDEMAGLLIYTATSDSAGSLGGLVSQGEPQRLRLTLESALKRISWCSSDPLCLEAEAAGVDSLNLAACHACVLLPETSCETNNSFLDRAMLIGAADGATRGFFLQQSP